MFTRRDFIQIGAASVGSLVLRPFGLLPALAQNGPDYRALVCVFLLGGNDSNNTIVPIDDASYQAYLSLRGALALKGSALTPTVQSFDGAPYAFHSQLLELSHLFSSKELAIVANVGSLVQPLTRIQYQNRQAPVPSNLFSHIDQQLQWQTSLAQGSSGTGGWAGRVADYLAVCNTNSSKFPTFLSVAGNSLMGAGVSTDPAVVAPGQTLGLTGSDKKDPLSMARWTALNSLLSVKSGVSLVQAGNDLLANDIADAVALNSALSTATSLTTRFPSSGLGAQLQQVAQIMQVHTVLGMRRQIFFCSLDGFDTHSNELNALNSLYDILSQALAAFYDATQELGIANNVTTFTESDFSRTFRPNSSNGSDHAWGSHHLVLGGAVQGGRVFGKFPALQVAGPDDSDELGRWIPTTSIDQYGATLCSWFGIPDDTLATVFPNLNNFALKKLGFMG